MEEVYTREYKVNELIWNFMLDYYKGKCDITETSIKIKKISNQLILHKTINEELINIQLQKIKFKHVLRNIYWSNAEVVKEREGIT